MKTAGFPKAVNATQTQFLSLCELGGGPGGGPARSKIQHLLRESGKKLNEFAYEQIGQQMEALTGRNPWHVCFAVGMSWGHLAHLDVTFTEAAINLVEDWNDGDLKVARTFHYERGPAPIEETLRGPGSLPPPSTRPAPVVKTF